jgi:carotenoid cleavage dioxygenase-like enzyme
MAAPFPDHPYLQGYTAPFGAELDAPDLIIKGRLPDTLAGTFYRNGPDPQFAPMPGDTHHPFDGDGMVYAFTLGAGRAALRNRWVRTPKFLAERAAGRRLYGVFGNPRFNDPAADPAGYDTANTHIWPHAGRLYALMEGCPPTELHPDTLETIGYERFAGAVSGPFTAHPKEDPATGELFAFGWGAKGPGSTALRYNVIAANGKTASTVWLEQPYCAMMHDFALTENYVIFPCLPLAFSLDRARAGLPATAWETDKPAWFGVMPRYGSADDLRWYEADPTFAYHVANAREQGGDIVVDVAGSGRAPLMPDATGRPPTWEDSRLTLKRWILTPATGAVRYETLDDTSLQFPRIDDRVNGRAYGQIYFNGASDPMMTREDGFDTLGVYDVRTGRKTLYTAPGESFGEPVFVPDATGPEGSDHLLSIAFRPATNTSALTVFNAAAIADGPVAEILVPVRIPAGFHCHWRGAVA